MGADTVTLRAIGPADRAVWTPLWRAYLAFYDTVLPTDAYDAAFAQLLSDDPAAFRGFLAWRGDTALGLVHYVMHPHMWQPAGTCYLQDLYTAPEARGQGIARRLIDAVSAAAKTQGVASVYWMTQQDNATARRLYDRVGTLTPFIKYMRTLP
ncbi:GCN5 family N-acetyltransferase [Jannaschia pagri]|uniref:GCN5 family N-acetyltransferase n=1 Tax=Jannaschia pagri TaxID=2829797 RepID=A0ABQ4NJ45_9RHOB|nr:MULTISPECIES: GNAT family N-acetyltransferase [unclassified Jannaschia]GIT90600.1 GCN5 family N-acetyltransferase [Jannaschia sp. AI_61]GIT94432.1 GCN5 family N-acetyltransferase [Jannaschia sp. AI_62]